MKMRPLEFWTVECVGYLVLWIDVWPKIVGGVNVVYLYPAGVGLICIFAYQNNVINEFVVVEAFNV